MKDGIKFGLACTIILAAGVFIAVIPYYRPPASRLKTGTMVKSKVVKTSKEGQVLQLQVNEPPTVLPKTLPSDGRLMITYAIFFKAKPATDIWISRKAQRLTRPENKVGKLQGGIAYLFEDERGQIISTGEVIAETVGGMKPSLDNKYLSLEAEAEQGSEVAVIINYVPPSHRKCRMRIKRICWSREVGTPTLWESPLPAEDFATPFL